MNGQSRDTGMVHVYEEDRKRLFDLKNYELKSIADVVSYLLDHHDHHEALDASLEGLNPLKKEES